MAKADKTYVFKGQIYLEGAEMPEDWVPRAEPEPTPGVKMHGPEGLLEKFPDPELPPGFSKIEEPAAKEKKSKGSAFDALGIEDLSKLASERGINLPRTAKKSDYIAALKNKGD